MKITEQYRHQQRILHATSDYGVSSKAYAPLVSQIINKLGVTELLDYGAGRGNLMRYLDVNHALKIQCYDPAIEEWADDPIPMQMCACIDVLEHVEPECLDDVLNDLKRVTGTVGFFTISIRPAEKFLSDGRNAHLILKSPEWWLPKFIERFELQTFQRLGDEGFYVIVYSKPEVLTLPAANDEKKLILAS